MKENEEVTVPDDYRMKEVRMQIRVFLSPTKDNPARYKKYEIAKRRDDKGVKEDEKKKDIYVKRRRVKIKCRG